MKHRTIKLAVLLLLVAWIGSEAQGQSLSLGNSATQITLAFDPNRLVDYTFYEQIRLGVGGKLQLTSQTSRLSSLSLSPYVAYGRLDQQWKYGLTLSADLSKSVKANKLLVGYAHDYFGVGSRRIDNPSDADSRLLGSFLARRMTRQNRMLIAYCHAWGQTQWMAEGIAMRRAPLFDNGAMLYLRLGDTVAMQSVVGLRLAMHHNNGLRVQTEVLHSFAPTQSPLTLRLLAEYRKSRQFGRLVGGARAQGGLVNSGAEYVDLFDFSGSLQVPFYVGQEFTMLNVNEFTAHYFLLFSLRLATAKPLVNYYSDVLSIGTNPTPNISLTALWGGLWNQTTEGQATINAIQVQAPHQGFAEVRVGIDGLIRWGVVDWGVAYALRLTPPSAPYTLTTPSDRRMFLLTGLLHVGGSINSHL